MKVLLILCLSLCTLSHLYAANCSTNQDRSQLFGNMSTANGTSIPYEICTPTQLRNIRFYPNSNFILGDDLDLDFAQHEPILQIFRGQLDGNGKVISNIILKNLNGDPVGIFHTIEDGILTNLTFENVYIEGTERVGLLAGQWRGGGSVSNINVTNLELHSINYGGGLIGLVNELGTQALTIDQINLNNVIIRGISNIGGILGLNNSVNNELLISNIDAQTDIVADKFVGGIAGQTLNNSFTQNTVTINGNLSCFKEYCGGVIGRAQYLSGSGITMNGNIQSSFHTEDSYVGGIVGHAVFNLNLTSVSYTGDINAQGNYVGGISGASFVTNFQNVSSSGQITNIDQTFDGNVINTGGLLGRGHDVTIINNSHSTMAVTSHGRYVGGLAGYIDTDESTITNSYSTGDILGRTSFIGGLVGFFDGAILEDSYATGNVAVDNPTPFSYIGGLLGYANSWNSLITRVYALGDVTVNNGTADYIGGLIGFFRGGDLSDCYANGNVAGGRNSVGGLNGIHRGNINRCYAIGNVSASGKYIGGLVGHFNAGLITNTLAVGTIKGKSNVGGLIGKVYSESNQLAVDNSHAIGNILRVLGSTEDPSSFGRVIGNMSFLENVGSSLICLNSSTITDESSGTDLVGINQNCNLTSEAKMRKTNSYGNYDFTNDWEIASSNWVFPNSATSYKYAKLLLNL